MEVREEITGFRHDVVIRFRPDRTSGSFAVKKSREKDRLIGDRRRDNAEDWISGKARLPEVSQCRRIRMRQGTVLRGTI